MQNIGFMIFPQFLWDLGLSTHSWLISLKIQFCLTMPLRLLKALLSFPASLLMPAMNQQMPWGIKHQRMSKPTPRIFFLSRILAPQFLADLVVLRFFRTFYCFCILLRFLVVLGLRNTLRQTIPFNLETDITYLDI